MNGRNLILIPLLVGMIGYASPAMTQHGGQGSRGGWDRGLDQAVSQAREQTGGRVISAETREIDGQLTYIVRILTKDGKVKRLRIGASSGDKQGPPSKRKR